MARKPRAHKSAPKARRAAQTGDAILDAALAEAAAVGWHEMTLAAVAERAGIGLGALLTETPTKAHLLGRLMRHIDQATLSGITAPDEAAEPRDRLFDVMMRRFDALNRHRDGVQAVLRGLRRDPGHALLAWLRMDKSGAAMLAAAGLSAEGICGFGRVQGLKAIYLAGLRAWMRDDTADMANTMAAVDRALRQAERVMRFNPFRRRGGEAREPAGA